MPEQNRDADHLGLEVEVLSNVAARAFPSRMDRAGACRRGRAASAGRSPCSTGISDDPRDAGEIAEVRRWAKAGLGEFVQTPSARFLGLGNAELGYCKNALTICEALTAAFLSHFRERGFKVAMPQKRMTVITLKDAASYRALLGDNPGAAVGGHYELDTNRLVVFDFRPSDVTTENDLAAANPEILNLSPSFTRAFICFRITRACLDARRTCRHASARGWRRTGSSCSKGRGKIGAINGPRVKAIVDPRGAPASGFRFGELLTGDALFNNAKTEQLAYAEAWVLVHFLLQRGPQQLPRFLGYLSKIPALGNAGGRLKVAEAELGSLKILNEEVRRHAHASSARRNEFRPW